MQNEKIGGRSPLLYQISADPTAAKAAIDDAITACEGVRKDVASAFGVHYVTLLRRIKAAGWSDWFNERCDAARVSVGGA